MGEVVAITHHLDALAAHVVRLAGPGLEVDEQLLRRLRGVTYRVLLDQDEEPHYEELSTEARAAANSLQENQAFLELCGAGERHKAEDLRHLLASLLRCQQVHLHPTGDGIHPSPATQLPARFHLPSIQLPLKEHAAVVSLLLALKGLKLQKESSLTSLLHIVASQNAAAAAGTKSSTQGTRRSAPIHHTTRTAVPDVVPDVSSTHSCEQGAADSKPWRDYVLCGTHKQRGSSPDERLAGSALPGGQIRKWAASVLPNAAKDGYHAPANITATTPSITAVIQRVDTTREVDTSKGHGVLEVITSSNQRVESARVNVTQPILTPAHPDAIPKQPDHFPAACNHDNKQKNVPADTPPAAHLELSPRNLSPRNHVVPQPRPPLYDATNMFKKASTMQGGTFMRFTPDDAIPRSMGGSTNPSSRAGASIGITRTDGRASGAPQAYNAPGPAAPGKITSGLAHAKGAAGGGTDKDRRHAEGRDDAFGSWYPFPFVLNPSASSPSDPTCWSETVARLLAGSCYTASPAGNPSGLARPSAGLLEANGRMDKFQNVSLDRAGRPSASALATVLPVIFPPGFTTVFKAVDASVTRSDAGDGGNQGGYYDQVDAKGVLVRMDEAVREQGRAGGVRGGAGQQQAGALTGGVKLAGSQRNGRSFPDASHAGDDHVPHDRLEVERELCLMAMQAMQGIPSAVKAALGDDSAKYGLHRWATSSNILKRAADCGKMRIRLDAFVAYWGQALQQTATVGGTSRPDAGSFRDPIQSAFVEALSSTLQGISIGLWDLYRQSGSVESNSTLTSISSSTADQRLTGHTAAATAAATASATVAATAAGAVTPNGTSGGEQQPRQEGGNSFYRNAISASNGTNSGKEQGRLEGVSTIYSIDTSASNATTSHEQHHQPVHTVDTTINSNNTSAPSAGTNIPPNAPLLAASLTAQPPPLNSQVPTMVQFTLLSNNIFTQLRVLSLLCDCHPSALGPISLEEDLSSSDPRRFTGEAGRTKNTAQQSAGAFSHDEVEYEDMDVDGDGDEGETGRPPGPYSDGYKRLRRAMAELGMEPSGWEARGRFMTGCELLGKLYDCVQRCDAATRPLMQHLFQVAFTPYVQHVWTWLYTPKPLHPCLTVLESHSNPTLQWWPDNVVDPFPGTPCEGPNFMQSMHSMLVAAGQQLRFLSSLKDVAGDVSGSIWWLAQQEAAELTAIADMSSSSSSPGSTQLSTPAQTSGPSSRSYLPLSGSLPAAIALDQPLVPIVFEREALQQVCRVSDQAAKQRAAEVERLLRRVTEQQEEKENAAKMEATMKVERQQAEREAARQRKNEQVSQLRLRQSRMLKEQQQAMDAAASQRAKEREERLAQEQEMLVSAVMREHTALTAALAAEVARNQALQPKLQAQEQRYSWREKRLRLGPLRRAVWMLIETEEERELREKLRESGAQLPDSKDLNQLELKSEHLRRLIVTNSVGRADMGVNNNSPVAGAILAVNNSVALTTLTRSLTPMPNIPEVDVAAAQAVTSSSSLLGGIAPAGPVIETATAAKDQQMEPTTSSADPSAEPMDVDEEPAAAEQLPLPAPPGSTPMPDIQPPAGHSSLAAFPPATLQFPQLNAPNSFSQRKATSFPEAFSHSHHNNSDGIKHLFTSPHWAATLPSQSPPASESRPLAGAPFTDQSNDVCASGTSHRALSFRQVHRSSADAVVDIRKGRLRRGDSVPTGIEVGIMRAAGVKTGELTRARGLWTMPADPLPAAGMSSRRLQRSTSTPSSPAVGNPFGVWPGSPFARQGFMAARQQQTRGIKKQLSTVALTPTKWGEHPWDLMSTPAKDEQPTRIMRVSPGKFVPDAQKLERAKLRKMYSQQDGQGAQQTETSSMAATAEVSEVVDAYVLQPIRAQYQLLTDACWRLMVKELKLLDLCHAFKLFFFMDAGDFADRLASSLNARLAGGQVLGPFTVQFLLEDAMASTAHASNEFASCLTARYERNRRLYTESPQLMGDSKNKLMDELEDGDAFCLQMQVKWPLSVVICSQSMQLYSRIVSVLLRLRRVSKLLHQIWMALTKPNCHVSATRNLVGLRNVVDPTAGGGAGNVQKQRLMQARRWLSHALPLITSLQGALQGSLVWGIESELLEHLSARPLSLMEMRETHLRLVKQAASCCFLEVDDEASSPNALPSVMSAVSAIWVVARQLGEAMNRDDLINPTSWVLEDAVWQEVKSSADRMMRYIKAVHRVVQQEAHRGGMAGNIAVLLDTDFYQRKSGRTFHG